MVFRCLAPFLLYCFLPPPSSWAEDFISSVAGRDLLTQYCIDCHAGPDAEARIDLEALVDSMESTKNPLESEFGIWKDVQQLIADGVMPPADADIPTQREKEAFANWFNSQLAEIKAKPGPVQVRRLAKHEYRNTLRSVFGFDLQVNIQEAEQTISEKSLVLKLLPVDPPGKSGFTNDTLANPLSDNAWDQYMYLSDAVIRELFQPHRLDALSKLVGRDMQSARLTPPIAEQLLNNFLSKARRRDVTPQELAEVTARINGLDGEELIAAVRLEMQAELLSPRFLFRSALHQQKSDVSQGKDEKAPSLVDEFELAERLSYFLWADMPDDRLMSLARAGELRQNLPAQVSRMLRSSKSVSLANDFGVQWLGLDEINLQVANNPPQLDALRKQPTDFLNYLFTESRPLLELLSSNVTFVNPHTAKYYGGRIYKQLPKYRKQKGIEIEIVANKRVTIDGEFQRGGILTMPGVLAMNRSPILRGTWLLERILGQELPEPPPNVPAIQPAPDGAKLSFRQRFEQHRAQATCAVCHDKIDPLGFAFEQFDSKGKLRKTVQDSGGKQTVDLIDTSGKLPSGEEFETAEDLKRILMSSQRESIIKNIVEKTLAYALCRELTVYDVPTVDKITVAMLEPEATWEDLFQEVARSLPFQHYRPPGS